MNFYFVYIVGHCLADKVFTYSVFNVQLTYLQLCKLLSNLGLPAIYLLDICILMLLNAMITLQTCLNNIATVW